MPISMTHLKQTMDEIQASDNLTPIQIMKMDMYEYHRELVDRAQRSLGLIS